jgi:DNA-binding MarR family transcriptional regulator
MTGHGLPPRPLIGLLLRLLNQQWSQQVDAALRAAGFDIRPPHANVFPFVPPDGIQVGELAARSGVRKQTMAQSVEELEHAGYVERRPDPKDRRGKLVFLTPRGESVRPIGKSAGRRVEQRWSRLIGRDELEHLRRTLTNLLHQLDDQPQPATRRQPRRRKPPGRRPSSR